MVVGPGALVYNRLSLPPWSVQTEGRWTAYGIHKWAFVAGDLPLGLALILGGTLLWPFRPTGLIVKGVGALALVITLAGLAALTGLTYGLLRNVVEPAPTRPTVLELLAVLVGMIGGLSPLLAVTVLGGTVARKALQRRELPAS